MQEVNLKKSEKGERGEEGQSFGSGALRKKGARAADIHTTPSIRLVLSIIKKQCKTHRYSLFSSTLPPLKYEGAAGLFIMLRVFNWGKAFETCKRKVDHMWSARRNHWLSIGQMKQSWKSDGDFGPLSVRNVPRR